MMEYGPHGPGTTPAPKKLPVWVIVVLVLIVLCCLCFGAIGLIFAFGDSILYELGIASLLIA